MEFKKLEKEDIIYMKNIIESDEKKFDKASLEEFIEEKNSYGFICAIENNVVAFLYGYEMIRPDGKCMFYIHSIDVLPKYQNQGIGTKLLEYTINSLKEENKCYKFFVLADNENIRACKLYSKFANSENQILFSNKL